MPTGSMMFKEFALISVQKNEKAEIKLSRKKL